MKPKKVWANLGVKDVERTRKFYITLGFKPNEAGGGNKELTSFLIGNENFVVHFFRNDVLKTSMKSEIADLKLGNEIMFTLSAESRDEVNGWAEEVKEAGGIIFSEPVEFGEGYYGFGFSDPDGHRWNVFHM